MPISTPMRMTGLFSGMDTEAMVKQLMKAESVKMNKLRQSRQLLAWKQEAYRSTATYLQTFSSSMLDTMTTGSMRRPSTFETLTAAAYVSGSSGTSTAALKVSVNGANGSGTHKLEVHDIAKKDVILASKDMGKLTASSAPSLDIVSTGGDDYSFNIQLDEGAVQTITLTAAEIEDAVTMEDIADKLTEKIADKFGTDINTTLTDNPATTTVDERESNKVTVSFTNGLFSIDAGTGHTAVVSHNSSSEDGFLLVELGLRTGGSTALNTKATLKDKFSGLTNGKLNINGVDIEYKADMTIDELMSAVNTSTAGVTMSYDKLRNAFKLESKNSGKSGKINIGTSDALATALGFDGNKTYLSNAQDATFTYDDVWMSRESNNFNLDGIDYGLTEDSVGKTFTVDITRDTANTMDSIKKFVEEYNKLVEALHAQINTSRPKSDKYTHYDPLSEEEKDAMSDNEIEKWEAKAKTGMLYRDDILTNMARQIREMMYTEVVQEDGSKISLYQIGIKTTNASGYIGKLEIDEAKLQQALNSNPEGVKALFIKESDRPGVNVKERNARLKDEGLGERLYDIIRNAVDTGGSISERAGIEKAGSDKNNTIYDQLSDYDEKISDMLTYLADREDYYYNLFAQMENAMAQADRQMSSLTSMLGQ